MPLFGSGHEVVTSTTRPASPAVGQLIYQTDTDEYLKYVSYGGANRWMQADVKANRRININGDMSVWQRGTSFSGSTVLYTADRWQFSPYGGSGAVTISQQTTTPPTGFRYFMRMIATTTSVTNLFLCQSLETSDVIKTQNKQVTLSFWYKNSVNATGLFNANILYSTAIDGNLMIPNAATSLAALPLSNSATWTFVSLSGIVPSNATSLAIRFDTTNNIVLNAGLDLTGIQLEIGSAPSEFEFESYTDTLRKCQRYYHVIKSGPSTSNSPVLYRVNYGGSFTNYYCCTVNLPVTPRITNGITFPVFSSSLQIHKPNIRWDVPSAISAEILPGGSTQYQINVTPSIDDGSTVYGIFLHGIGIIYNGEL